MEQTYFKVIGIGIDALSAEIIADGNVKDIDGASLYIKEHVEENKNATWVILPCSCKI